ncbi:glycoside hydrolase superfamily [Chytridium lagenaria]|nr:glycoside hydrolase superfamily [Chytridium lagenaria]
MSRTPRMLLCNCFFWSKVTFALVLALSGILFCSIRVYDLRQYALADLRRSAVIRNNGSIPIPTNADGTATTQCYHDENGLARLEIPDRGRMMMGFHLNWEVDNPTAITNRLGRVAPAVINAFMKVDMTQIRPFDFDSLRWHGYEVQKVGGILELTLEPVSDIDGIPDTFYDEVARELRAINSEKGVPVFLRWGHEMNGDWVLAYGYRPISYKTSFIKMADAVRRYTNMTAMVWAPNVGIQYPFNAAPGDGSAPKPRPGTAEFRELDTDNNGVIAPGDDPYLPYYPGDEHVDWVGLSIYFYPLADKYLRRQMNLVDLENQVARFGRCWIFYDRFCRQRNKPMLAIKKAWWTQMWSRDTISLMAETKARGSLGRDKCEWGWDLGGGTLVMARDMEFKCDGSVVLR